MSMTDSGDTPPDWDEEFRQFVVASRTRLVRLADLLTHDRGRAEDLVQHAYTQTFLAWKRVRKELPEAYARRCVVNAHLDWWRRRRWFERPVDSLVERPTGRDDFAAVARRDVVVRALARLTRRERVMVALRFLYDLPESEVARELGVRLGTVKSTTARALAKLRQDAQLCEERSA